ncbi:hypothetical protein SDC9_155297 [bioreactor metagenome]|uniref:Uncharacterized protein n=1 Tax=bioreactor metagenome TaxID=1076179 RepID=A0A645F164_9ZZZZ
MISVRSSRSINASSGPSPTASSNSSFSTSDSSIPAGSCTVSCESTSRIMLRACRASSSLPTPETASFFRFKRFSSSRWACFLISCTIGRRDSGTPETCSTGISCRTGVRPLIFTGGPPDGSSGFAACSAGAASPVRFTFRMALPTRISVPNGISQGWFG